MLLDVLEAGPLDVGILDVEIMLEDVLEDTVLDVGILEVEIMLDEVLEDDMLEVPVDEGSVDGGDGLVEVTLDGGPLEV